MVRKLIHNSINMEEKCTPSDRILNRLSLVSAIAAVVLFVGCLIAYFVHNDFGLKVFQHIFYPLIILNLASIFIGLSQVIRNRYFTVVMAVSIGFLTLAGIIVCIILQGVFLHKVYIVPFIFFSK